MVELDGSYLCGRGSSMGVLFRFFPYLRPYRYKIMFGTACLLLSIPCQLFPPLIWKFIVDTVIIDNHPSWLLPALLVMVAVYLVGAGLSAIRTYILGKVGQGFIFDLRNDIYRRLQRQSVGFFHNKRSGDLISRAISDVESLQEIIIFGVDNILVNFLSFIGVAGIIIALHPVVGVVTLVPVLGVGLIVYFFNTRIKGLYRRIREHLGDLTAKLQENLTGMALIKAFARDAHEVQRFSEQNEAYRRENMKGVVARAFYFPSVLTVGFFSNVAMIGLGGYFVLKGTFTIGGLMAYRGYWWQLFSPVQQLAQINETIQRAIAAGSRVVELMDEEPEIQDGPEAVELDDVQGNIDFEGAGFRYTPEVLTLQAMDFSVEAGHTIGIVGPSGAGKSTVLHLLMRFYDPTFGRILLDGRDLREVRQLSLRSHFAVVSQDAFLFNDTVMSNVGYGRLGASEGEITRAIEMANAREFVEQLPSGYDTILGERGVKLSGGQRQRLCIARAFLANPKILLLDEATASVETESEMLIQGALQELMKGRTTVIVSHRLTMVRDADQILVISEGELIESGTHEELMRRNGWYTRMYRIQMQE
jgi:ATP-binding cassette subfamily B protein